MSSIFNLQAPIILEAEQTTKDEFVAAWRGRQLYSGQLGLGNPHVAQVAFRVLGALAASTAATFIVLSLCSIVVLGHSVIIPLCVLTSIFSFMRAKSIQSEQEAKALESMRQDIANLSLKEVASEYSWNQLFTRGILSPDEFAIRYREQVSSMTIMDAYEFYERAVKSFEDCPRPKHIYYVPLPSELRDKWVQETQEKTFEQIIETYPIEKLYNHNILSEREFNLLTELNGIYQAIKNERDRDLSLLFPHVDQLKRELEAGFAEIEAAYRNDPAIQRLDIIDAESNAKRDAIINQYAQLIKQEIDEAYAPCHEYLQKYQGKYFNRLRQDVRKGFEVLKKAYAEKELEIRVRLETARNSEIVALEEQYGGERVLLTLGAQTAKETRDAQIVELKAKIENTGVSDEQIEERFHNVVNDLNAQFTARRYVLRMG